MTRKQLEKFIRIRNKSGWTSNLQFYIDAQECGFAPSDLGRPTPFHDNYGFYWPPLPHGVLVERLGVLTLHKPGTQIDPVNGGITQ